MKGIHMSQSQTPTRESNSIAISESHGMQAVKFPRFGRIAFLAVPISEMEIGRASCRERVCHNV